jgi:hypothetical protein
MNNKFYIILFAVFLFSCSSNKKNEKEYDEKRVQFLKDFVTKSDTLYTFKYDSDIFHFDELIDNQQIINRKTSLIYILNSECSVCIGEFLDFVFHLGKSEENLPLIAIINQGEKYTMQYYMEQFNEKQGINLTFIENSSNKYVNDLLEKQNGKVFYIFKNKIINGFSYVALL